MKTAQSAGEIMEELDEILSGMDGSTRERLKQRLNEYRITGDPSAKEEVIGILRDFDDREALILLLRKL